MTVLFVTSELAGYVKTGGLADVSAALPKALRARGWDVRVLLPYYGEGQRSPPPLTAVARLDGAGAIPPCEIAAGTTEDGLPVYFVVCPSLYERAGTPYADAERADWPDNDVRFARLSLAAAQIADGQAGLRWRPHLLHANDWPAALTCGYLAWRKVRVPGLFTVHNLAHQGLFDPSRMSALAIPGEAYALDGIEFHQQISFLKAGLICAQHVTTVSPTYAREITTEALGAGLHGLLAGLAAAGRLSGIANGIGEDWSPTHDPNLVRTYPPDAREAKQRNADALRAELGLHKGRRPLFAMVSRFAHQKGVDLALHAADTIVAGGGQVAMIGEGDRELEQAARNAMLRHPGLVGVRIAFDERLSHLAVAGSDFYLMPSRFEPCGLNQMYAQRYGSLPIAHATGGLVDTIEDGKTGFLFSPAIAEALDKAIVRALQVYIAPRTCAAMRRAAMDKDFSWAAAAARYDQIYRGALAHAQAAA